MHRDSCDESCKDAGQALEQQERLSGGERHVQAELRVDDALLWVNTVKKGKAIRSGRGRSMGSCGWRFEEYSEA